MGTPRVLNRCIRLPAKCCLLRQSFALSLRYRNIDLFPIGSSLDLPLGADLPREDYLYPGNLGFAADIFLVCLCVTHAYILSSNTSSEPPGSPSQAYGMLSYPSIQSEESIKAVNSVQCLSPVESSAHRHSTSKLLRTF